MNINDMAALYGKLPQSAAFLKLVADKNIGNISAQGLVASAAPVFFASLFERLNRTVLFVLNDADEAGYFYNDMAQMLGQQKVLFFPSSYKRAVKYGQRDAANEILRTEVLARLSSGDNAYIVTCPEALSELVARRKVVDERMITLSVGQEVGITNIVHSLRDFGFAEVDYVYEPGQFCIGCSGLQLNHSFEPSSEHLAIACSTNERGIRATSSSRTPPSVMP